MDYLLGDEFINFGLQKLCIYLDIEDSSKLRSLNIKYNKDVNLDYQYKMIRTLRYDGTLWFRNDKIFSMFLELLSCETIYKEYEKIDLSVVKDIIYHIGDMTIESKYPVYVKDKNFPVMEDTFLLPVRCEIVY